GTLSILGSLSANGVGTGSGGTISLKMNTNVGFTVGDTGANNQSNRVISLSANSGTSGNGGLISIEQDGTAGISVVQLSQFAPLPLTVSNNQGDGGQLAFKAKSGTVSISGGTLNASANNAGGGKGGSITVEANSLAALSS